MQVTHASHFGLNLIHPQLALQRLIVIKDSVRRGLALSALTQITCDEDESTRSRVELALGRIDEAIADCSYARHVRSATNTTGEGDATAV